MMHPVVEEVTVNLCTTSLATVGPVAGAAKRTGTD